MRRILMGGGILVILLMGCGQPKATLAGGKSISHWLQALQAPDPTVRKTAVNKLGNIGTADPAALPAVVGALKDPDAAVRCEAILALLRNGPAAKEALPTLMEMQRSDRNAQVRSYAAQALAKLQRGK